MLSNRQKQFVLEYPIDCNATQAAIRAGYSVHTANEQAARLLAKVSIREAINAVLDKRAEKTALTSESVIQSLLRIRDAAQKEKKYSDAIRANELLGKHLKMFSDRPEYSANANHNISVLVMFGPEGATDCPPPIEITQDVTIPLLSNEHGGKAIIISKG